MGESDDHALLKDIGLALLLRKGCSPAGTEVRLPVWERARWYRESRSDKKAVLDFAEELAPSPIAIADAAGVIWIHPEKNDFYGTNRVKGIFAMEAKVSRSDFKRGFVTHGWNKLWIITPAELLDVHELPGGIGLYEYDADKGTVTIKSNAALRPFEPSETAINDIVNSILWQGYGRDVDRIYRDERVRKVLGFSSQQTFEKEPETEG